ncbi:DUF4139 domain-containing protein [Pusillimonas noertemannii]|uniref:Uncharacterized protein DUF4139 n=1 Tax=Pusillimonas noertemannii TaxID=305977 RepID=A0A2U1CQ69_9BURK|nr:DUF4139 domain-containing protein [Pusillimonas noertemannii]NYT67352.1 DUF4139 domain-containing protein [Pusillimonas noertemannii]PVY68025.1 uncharacterized protein DUF4139 [Pusillimonas noertemannii]
MRLAAVFKPVITTLAASVMACGGGALAAQSGDRITSFVLSSGGLAQIERRVGVEDQPFVQLSVPLEQVDDVLKSLVVHDPGGHATSIVLDGEAPVQEAFSRLPFGPEALSSPAELAAALPGMRVRASSGGRTVQGRVLGVEPAREDEPGALLSVMTPENQVQALRLGADTVLELLDDSLQQRLQAALQASGQRQADTRRSLNIGLAGKGARDVTFSYVVAAPVWKSAYRLSTGEQDQARLQAWAVLENASGQDWDGVKVTLVSGVPVTLSQKLYQRYWHVRPELPVAVGAAEAPRADTSAMMEAADAVMPKAAAPALRSFAAGRAAPPAPAPEAPSMATEGQTDVRYELPRPITVAAGQTASVPFIDAQVQAERVSVFQADRGGLHPVAAVWLKNTTQGSLPPGILTVYDERGGHLGDAQLPAIPVGESRFLYFAEDGKVEVRAEQHPQERLSELSISQGVLRAQRLLRRESVYTIKGAPDAPRTVIIEQPRRQGWKLESDQLAGETVTHYRLRAEVPAQGTATVRAVASRQEQQTVALADTNEQTLAAWSANAADERSKNELRRLADLRRELSDAQRQEQMLEEQLGEAAENQARVRDNLAAVPPDSALGQRYLAALEKEEDHIGTLRERRQAAQQETASRRKALEGALAER